MKRLHRWKIDEARRSWLFRETRSRARVLELRSTAERDVVIFRFDGELSHRKVRARSFLRNFQAVPR